MAYETDTKPLFTESEKRIFCKIGIWREWITRLERTGQARQDQETPSTVTARQEMQPFDRLCSRCPRT